MTPTETGLTQDLIDRGLSLPPEDRERFARLQLNNVPDADGEEGYTEEELHDELVRRWEEYQRGDAKTYSLDEVMASLRQQAEQRAS